MPEPPTFIPADGLTPEEFFEGPMFRRLCIIRFQCPLCLQDHEGEYYITLPAADLDEYVAQLRKRTSDWKTIEPAITNATLRFHLQEGDLPPLVEKAAQQGLPNTRPPTIELTDESTYTCDECSRTFDTVRQLRDHMNTCR